MKIARRAINAALGGCVDPLADPWVRGEKERIKEGALQIIEAIKSLGDGKDEDLLRPEILFEAVGTGILDAPAVNGFSVAKGVVKTALIDGQCRCVHEEGKLIKEKDRLKKLLEEARKDEGRCRL